jgi:hypothetical protein
VSPSDSGFSAQWLADASRSPVVAPREWVAGHPLPQRVITWPQSAPAGVPSPGRSEAPAGTGAPVGAGAADLDGVRGRSCPYPSSTDTLGSTQVRVAKFTYPDGGFDGVAVIRNPMRCVQSRSLSGGALPRPDLADFVPVEGQPSGGCLFCESEQKWQDNRGHNAERSVRRSSVKLRRLARYNDLTRLITFTNGATGAGWESRKVALDDVARFLKVHGRECFGRYRSILVAEQGGKGARWHVHGVIPAGGWLKYSAIIARWSDFMERRGWHSASGTHRWHCGDEHGKHKGKFSSARVAGHYIAKYLTKDLATHDYGSGVHRYRYVGTDNPLPDLSHFRSMSEALSILTGCHLTPIEQPDTDGVLYVVGYWFEGG